MQRGITHECSIFPYLPGSGISPLYCNLKTHEDVVMKLNSLVMTSIPHEKTGKNYLKSASFQLEFSGQPVFIDLEEKRVLVSIGMNDPYARVFERSVPLIQLLYYIQAECQKI